MTTRSFKHTALAGAAAVSLLAAGDAMAKATDYVAGIEAIPSTSGVATPDTVTGTVFHDINRNGSFDADEPGIEGVMVSNGLDVVQSGADGSYTLPARDSMSVMIVKPAGFDVPVDEDNIPQFAYHHLPEGSPPLRFGGLEPTGDLPSAINFPLVEADVGTEFSCVVMGDTQPYSNMEVSYVRDSIANELAAMDMSRFECVILQGDVMGDDLSLFPRFKDIMSVADTPVYFVGGNHDLDFDAPTDANSFDTFKREWGPAYYAFEIGDVVFVGLDNVRYPCTEEDAALGNRDFCADPMGAPTYNGVISDEQMTWLENTLEFVPEDKLIVLNMHIPLVSFVDQEETKHQTDNVADLYALIGDRPALALSGHTHTLEQFRPGESFEGWQEAVGVGPTPFPQIITGAPSGSWWSGDLDVNGIPMSLQRLGSPRGYLVFDFDGNTFVDTFKASGQAADDQMSISFNTPTFREWYTTLRDWMAANEGYEGTTPPVNVNDLNDYKMLTDADLAGGTHLMVNVWNGSQDTQVAIEIPGMGSFEATRTQEGAGEGMITDAEFVDPFALVRQMTVARFSHTSASGDERAQGWRTWQGAEWGPGVAGPLREWMLTDQSSHLYALALPPELPHGTHVAYVTVTDHHGREFFETITFEVVEEKPNMYWQAELFETVTN